MSITEVGPTPHGGSPKQFEQEFEQQVLQSGSVLGIELEPSEVRAIGGLLARSHPLDDGDAELRFDIIQAKYRQEHDIQVSEHHLALYSLYRLLQQPEA
jgi:hypothetical protein